MNVLLVGGGAREHIIGEKIVKDNNSLYTIMSNLNPGLKRISKEFLIENETNVENIIKWDPIKNNKIDIAIIGPEAPLEKGIINQLENLGIKCASPIKEAAQIETSKRFMRYIMDKYKIPGNVKNAYFDDFYKIREYIQKLEYEFVVKPVGLTGGKGVKVQGDHFKTKEEGIKYAESIILDGIGGNKGVLIEEKLVGEEYTLQAFSDGNKIFPMPLVQDFKRAFENDEGPNTGGMGSYSMNNHLLPFIKKDDYEFSVNILGKIVDSLKKEGITYKGVIYGQFMITKNGPKVIEINARFGDPEAMNVLSIFEGNFVEILEQIADGNLKNNFRFLNKSTVVKYVVPVGYGTNPKSNSEIIIDENGILNNGSKVYYGSVNMKDGKLYTTHSRSIALVGIDDDIEKAEKKVENGLKYVKGEIYARHDIGRIDTINKKVERMKMIRG
ncbi:MAG: phosphoribosylamine--glycine ligase [Thermoplasmata archaeon]|nr:phosphoribosylamine--glycine ligase [Thermoplasmata archaeon]